MKRTLPFIVFCLFSWALTASNLPETAPSTVTFETQGNHLFVAFERLVDLETTRKIEIFNERGIRVFRGDAFSTRSVSGLNISKLNEGLYTIQITLFDQIVRSSFEKD